jgi:hypothetical protein
MPNLSKKIAAAPTTITSTMEDPRRTFESAIAMMQPGRSPKQTPIRLQYRAARPEDPATEKRAVADAARALARLWNVAPSMVR